MVEAAKTKETITLEEARRVIGGAERKAEEIGQPMDIAVVDAGGNLKAHVRMDGAFVGSITISINKAYTAIAFQQETAYLQEDTRPGGPIFGLSDAHGGRLVVFPGGIPESIPEGIEGREEIVEKHLVGPTMLGRAATLEDVGNVAAFVASDHARTMTAATVNISCGALVDF